MKLTYFQLETHLAKNLLPVYLISGDEPLLKLDALNLVRKTAKAAGHQERIRLTPEAGFDWEQLYTVFYSASLLADKKIIELDFRDSLPNKTATPILAEYAKKPSPDNVLLIDLSKTDDKVVKSTWYSALEKIGAAVPIWPVPREQLPQWIMQRAKKYKIQFQPDAAALLADFIEGNLGAAAQAIEKLYLLNLQKPVDAELITNILINESRFTVFDFVETVIAGDKRRALHILNTLQAEGVESTFILWGITRELRLLADIADERKKGGSFESLFAKYRIFAKRQAAFRRFLGLFSADDCQRELKHAMEIDNTIKGAQPGNAWDMMQLFCLRLI